MIVIPIEEFETARWKKYQKDILELVGEFEIWAKDMQEKYLKDRLTEQQRAEWMHRLSDDARHIICLDLDKLMGKK
jgi:hypothetical protein